MTCENSIDGVFMRPRHAVDAAARESKRLANDHDGIKTQVKVQAAYRGFKSRVGREERPSSCSRHPDGL